MAEPPPRYHLNVFLDDHPLQFMQPIADPFISTTVTLGWRDVLRAALRHRALRVSVQVGTDQRTATRILEMDPDYLGPAGSPSTARRRWKPWRRAGPEGRPQRTRSAPALSR